MSIGNLKDSGNQGNNYPWQYRVLLGLDKIFSALSGSTSSYLAPQERTPVVSRVSAAGSIPSGIYSVSFANVGSANGVLNGATFKPGETVNFDAGALNNTISTSFTYDATGTEFLIIYIQ